MSFRRFMSFERMVTPVIIKVIFWISLFLVAIGALGGVVAGVITGIREENVGMIIGSLVAGPIAFLLGILGVRVYTELLILLFRMNETLTDIKSLLQKKE